LPVDVVVPIPLHPKRERARGFNQAALLARELARSTGLPLRESALIRLRDTPPLANATGQQQRRTLVEGAFRATDELAAMTVLLVDDVCTTGATLESAASACLESGAADVFGLVLARAL
jgi:ComF family protein